MANKTRRRWKYTTVRQWGGDDGYQWAVFVKGQSRPRVCGLTRPEVNSYREQFEKEEEAKHGKTKQEGPARPNA